MTLLVLCVLVAIFYGLGHALVRRLGWPTDAASVGRWLLALFVGAVLLQGLPAVINQIAKSVAPLPALQVGELIVPFGLLGLGAIGFVAWSRGAEERARRKPEALLPRKRALPPPPAAHDDGDDDFAPVPNDGGD